VNQAIENNVGEEGSGVAVIVDVNTGEPLAICGIGAANGHALTFTYQPNSLFMPLVATAALAENVVSPESAVECTGVFDNYADEGCTQECSETHGSMNVETALEQDCQYFFCQMGNDLGIDSISDFEAAYGLGQSTGIELTEALGNLADRNQKVWRADNTLAVAVGQDDNSFTALQYAEYCAAIANGGNRYSASIVKTIGGKDGDVYSREAQQLSQVKQSSIGAVQQGMYERLNDRYASIWGDCALTTAGVNSGNLFMGYAPYDQPQIAVFVYADYSRTDSNVQELARDIINAYGELYC
jgi:penicillin-binding protein 2